MSNFFFFGFIISALSGVREHLLTSPHYTLD